MTFTPFGIDIGALVGGAWDGNAVDCTLTLMTKGAHTPGQTSAGTNPTPRVYTAQGFIADREAKGNDQGTSGSPVTGTNGSNTRTATTTIILFGALIEDAAVPVMGAIITMDSIPYRIEKVKSDGTGATYTCVCRG